MSEADEIADAIIMRHGGTIPRNVNVLRQLVRVLMPGEGVQQVDNVTEALLAQLGVQP